VFGDRLGLVVFLAGLSFVMLYWRIGVFLNDTYVFGNTLVNVASGSLAIERTVYSLTFGTQPGLHIVDGTVYGRNYGLAFAALPIYGLFELFAVVFDPRLVLVAFWSLLLYVTAEQVGHVFDHRRTASRIGFGVAVAVFLLNVVLATPLPRKWIAFASLQLTTMLAAALVGVGLYRVLGSLHGRRVGAVTGLAAAVATPVGFWASIPKRHAITALAAVALVASFYAARTTDAPRRRLGYRGVGYATIALTMWVHPPEGFVLFAGFAPVDLATAPSNSPRHLAVVALVFAIALTPFLATNALISGNPVRPPVLLPEYPEDASETSVAPSAGRAGGDSDSSEPSGGSARTPVPPPDSSQLDGSRPDDAAGPVASVTGTVAQGVGRVVRVASETSSLLVTEPERLYYTFVRSGRIPGTLPVAYWSTDQETVELTVLETLPVAAALLTLPVLFGRSVRRHLARGRAGIASLSEVLASPVRGTDVLVLSLWGVYVLVYFPDLPLFSQITVRYLVPTYPLLLYGVARLGPVRTVIDDAGRWLAGVFVVTLFVGAAGLTAALFALDLAIGEAMQLHALLDLAAGAALLAWVSLASLTSFADERVGAVVLGVPAALTTLFLLFSGLLYFQYGRYALPVARAIAEFAPATL
jgi:hypothetical protein